MPELPEVETLTRAVRETLRDGKVEGIVFFRNDLRDPIPKDGLTQVLARQPITSVERRSKYLLIRTPVGVAILHLGMTGNLLSRPSAHPDQPHTHVILKFVDRQGDPGWLHYVDPRRFGRLAFSLDQDLTQHPFFADLGPEPLDHPDLGDHLYSLSRTRKAPIKSFIMDARIVVGVGNIYASESLFRAGISPKKQAGRLTRAQYQRLATAIQATLKEAIAAGGTTLRDFRNAAGEPGYFAVQLMAYGRDGEPCPQCTHPIQHLRQSGRSTYFCPTCQK